VLTPGPELLPEIFLRWFEARGWSPREHQLALLEKARAQRSALLIAPTGAGKTLAGFLPTLVDLSEGSAAYRSAVLPQRAKSSPLPPARTASGGEGSGVGGNTRTGVQSR
jgi:ATP-dependent Lhr-like helicase